MRRYSTIKPSRGTVIPSTVRAEVKARDNGCVGPRVGMPEPCFGGLELDHVRASHGIGMKSETSVGNLATLCASHHRIKTNEGRTWRPILVEYLERVA
jgi:5-methylcytosine-specific restriction endonuclease McrA